jgi:dihydrofolate synthase/folylpolyglutamate synthase
MVVWETGMGGRLDATNVVTPLVSVIAPIGMDHQQWLGPTLRAIAGEKAGIIKPGVPVVSAAQDEEARNVLCRKAAEQDASLLFVENPYEGFVGLIGPHQKWNAAVALAALDAAGLVSDPAVRTRVLAAVQWPGRFQRVHDRLVIDGAHNVAAAEVLVAAWRETFGPVKARLIFGTLRDKNPAEILQVLCPIADEVVLVPVNSARSASPEELRNAAENSGFSAVRLGQLSAALEETSSTPTLVAGSLFLAGEALALLGGTAPPPSSNQ